MRTTVLLLCSVAGLALQAGTASAQAAAEAKELEAVVVTGSRIRGAGSVGSEVIAVGAEEIQRRPTTSVQDLLKTVPQVAAFGFDASSPVVQGTSGTNTTRGSSINLRGLGPQATLTLLDGRRLPASGVNGTYIDPNSIPSIALSRIEVVADGASAVYGSDAVAGVVNFIANKTFEGALSRVRYGYADGYDQLQIGQMVGYAWEGGNVVLAFEHTSNSNLNGTERSFIRSDLTGRGGRDYRGTQCNPGNIVVGGVFYAIPTGGVTPATASTLRPGTTNRCETFRLGDVLPKQDRNSAVLYARQDVTDWASVFFEGLYTKRSYVARAVQQGSSAVIATFNVPATNAFFVRPPGTAGTVSVQYNFAPDLGPLNQHGFFRVTHLTGGFEFKLPKEWRLEATGVYGRTDEAQNTQRILQPALTAALASNNPQTAFNPFGPGTQPQVFAQINNGLFNPYARNTIVGADVQANGPIFELPGGTARLAVGAEYMNYGLGAGSRQNDRNNPALAFLYTSRHVKSVFAEAYVPLIGDDNAMPLVQRLELSAALRYDDYSDVGDTTNPKVGLTWTVTDELQFKGSYGTSFRAPLLQDLILLRAGAALIVSTLPDPLSPTGTSTGLAVNAGNPNLTPEQATTWSFTGTWRPAWAPGLRLSATHWLVDYDDQISNPPRGASALTDPNYLFTVTRNPTQAQINVFLNQGLRINGTLPPTVAFLQNAQTQNLAATKARGWDFEATYAWDSRLGDFNVQATGSYVSRFDVQISPAAPLLGQVGNFNFPVRFRGRLSGGWRQGPWDADLAVNYHDNYRNGLVVPAQQVESFVTFDAHVGYTLADTGNRWLDGLSIALDAQNLFDEEPPFVNVDGGWDPGQASAVGRNLLITLTKRW